MTALTTLVRHAERNGRVGVVIATMERGGETHRFQIHRIGADGVSTILDSERVGDVGDREYVMSEFDHFTETGLVRDIPRPRTDDRNIDFPSPHDDDGAAS